MKKSSLRRLLLVLCLIGGTSFIATATTEPGLTNISTRAFVQTGDNVMIGGFIIERADPTKPAPPKRVIIRALGPELTQYGVPNVLANPTLELFDRTGQLIASNNNWATTIIGGIITASQVHEIQASGYAPSDPYESAIVADLPAGSYTAIVRGVNNLTGVGLVEVYDLSPETSLTLSDISTRGYVQTGDNVMIGGFTVAGTKPKGVILRALGPELSRYGVPNTLADPTLELYDSTGTLVGSNDNWQHTSIGGIIAADQVRDILISGLAPGDRNESVISATLPPGSYTAIVRGVNNTTGVALLEGRRASATYTWTGAVDSDWENAANWEPNGVPEKGDTAAIPSGTSNSPIIFDEHVQGVQIALGSSDGGSVILGAAAAKLIDGGLTVTGGTPGASTVNATLSCQGNVTVVLAGEEAEHNGVNGTIIVEAGTALTIDAGEGTFTLSDPHKTPKIDAAGESGTVAPSGESATFVPTATATPTTRGATKALVTQESSLFLKGQNIVTEKVFTYNQHGQIEEIIIPVIEIEGAAEIAEEVTIGGGGILGVESGGFLSVKGTVEGDEQIDFLDGTGRISIRNPTMFHGTVGFTPVAGARIDFPGIHAQSVGVHFSQKDNVYILTLHPDPNHMGTPVAEIPVQTIVLGSKSPLPSNERLTPNDFALSRDGNGGTRVTYLPGGRNKLQQSMPVPLIAPTGSKVSLETIFTQSFGTSHPAFHYITLLAPKPQTNTPNDYKYWINVGLATLSPTPSPAPPAPLQASAVTPAWFVHGKQIPPGEKHIIEPEDYRKVELFVGNNIDYPAQFDAHVTPGNKGRESEIVTYSVWTVDPTVAEGIGLMPGKPTPADIIASAHSLQRVFPDVPNIDLCNWIADNVAAAAGASQPLPNAYSDPSDNVEGGFWRIAYSGLGPNPVKNWFRLLMPGDIVRMQHDWGEGHTTTALSRQHPNGTVTVYSNGGGFFIGIHPSTAEKGTNPASITIYRLDPNQQYLILGSSLGEVIQGSVYNNLFRPGGGSDIIVAGPANNEIQDITSNLDGIAVRNFHAGDVLNFTNLHPNGTTVQYDAASAMLTVSRPDRQVAKIKLPGLNANAQFSVTRNGDGTNITLLP